MNPKAEILSFTKNYKTEIFCKLDIQKYSVNFFLIFLLFFNLNFF